jgi:hypothetical protein
VVYKTLEEIRKFGEELAKVVAKVLKCNNCDKAGQSFLGGLGGLIHFGIIIKHDPYHDGSSFFTLDI